MAFKTLLFALAITLVGGFTPSTFGITKLNLHHSKTALSAMFTKYDNEMDDILDMVEEESPGSSVLVNFYDNTTLREIYHELFTGINESFEDDNCIMIHVAQQYSPELTKAWDAGDRSPTMILFIAKEPVYRLSNVTDPLTIVTKVKGKLRLLGELDPIEDELKYETDREEYQWRLRNFTGDDPDADGEFGEILEDCSKED